MVQINKVLNEKGWNNTLISKEINGSKFYFWNTATYPTLIAIGEWLESQPTFHVIGYEIDCDTYSLHSIPYKQRGENLALWVKFTPTYGDKEVVEVYDTYITYMYKDIIDTITSKSELNEPLKLINGELIEKIDPNILECCKDDNERIEEQAVWLNEGGLEWVDMYHRDIKETRKRDAELSQLVTAGMKVRYSEDAMNMLPSDRDEVMICERIEKMIFEGIEYDICHIVGDSNSKYINRDNLVPAEGLDALLAMESLRSSSSTKPSQSDNHKNPVQMPQDFPNNISTRLNDNTAEEELQSRGQDLISQIKEIERRERLVGEIKSSLYLLSEDYIYILCLQEWELHLEAQLLLFQ